MDAPRPKPVMFCRLRSTTDGLGPLFAVLRAVDEDTLMIGWFDLNGTYHSQACPVEMLRLEPV